MVSTPAQPAPKPAPKPRRAKVSVPGTHFGECEVEYDTVLDQAVKDGRLAAAKRAELAKNNTAAAIEAVKLVRGIVSFGAGPQVEFLD